MPFEADPTLLRTTTTTAPNVILTNSRQSGKSTVAALKALHQAVYTPESAGGTHAVA